MHFGAALRLLRVDAGLSLRELARRIGVSSTYLSRVENGHDPTPTPERLRALADVLGMSRAALFDVAGQAGPEITGYLHRVPSAASLVLDLARRDLGPLAIARLRAFIDREFPEDTPRPNPVRVSELLTPERVVLGLRCSDWDDVLSLLVARLPSCAALGSVEILRRVRAREQVGSTFLGDGFALPHTTANEIPPCAALALLERPLAVPSPDHEPLRFAVLALLPAAPDGEIRVLSGFVRLAASGVFTELASARSELEALGKLRDAESVF